MNLRNMRNVYLAVLVAAFVVGTLALLSCKQSGTDGTGYKVAVLYPLTGPGAGIGESNRNGVALAIETINNAGGVNGRQLTPIFLDSKNDPKVAISEFNRVLSAEKPPIILSAISSVCMAVAPLAEEQRVTLFCDASHPQITSNKSYVFRNFPTADVEIAPIASLITQKLKPKTIGILTANDDYGLALGQSLKNAISSSGVAVRFDETFDRAGLDFGNQVDKVVGANPDAVYVGGFGKPLGVIIKQLRERGYKGQILGAFGLLVADARTAAGEAANGVYVAVPKFDLTEDAKVADFKRRYKEKFGSEPPFNAALTYDSTFLVADAIRRGGSEQISSEAIKNSLRGVQNFQGVTGALTIQPNGDVKSEISVGHIMDGQVRLVTDSPQ